MQTKLDNPFIISGRYVSEEYFCDRIVETQELMSNIINWRNTVLVSPRRMGKSGLIEHTFAQAAVKDNYETFYVDIFATSSVEELVFLIGKEIIHRLQPKGEKLRDRFFSVVNSITASIGYDAIKASPKVEISLRDIPAPQKSLEQIFAFMESNERPCVLAIDEFQQIAEYSDGKKTIAAIRTLVQSCRQTRFIFAGSNRRMMGKLFNTPSEPFFMSCSPLYLDVIDRLKYREFAKSHFTAAGKDIDDRCFDETYDRFAGHTWYVQNVLNRLYETTAMGTVADFADVDKAVNYILDVYNRTFLEMLATVSERQKMLLIAIAKSGEVDGLTGVEFVSKYGLRSASSVQGAARPLLENETLVRENGRYHISNRFFSLWLARRY